MREREAQMIEKKGHSSSVGLVDVNVAVCRVKELSLVVAGWKFRGRLPRFGPLAAFQHPCQIFGLCLARLGPEKSELL